MIIEYCLAIWAAPAKEVDEKLSSLLSTYNGEKPLAFFNLPNDETGLLFGEFGDAEAFTIFVNDTRIYFADRFFPKSMEESK